MSQLRSNHEARTVATFTPLASGIAVIRSTVGPTNFGLLGLLIALSIVFGSVAGPQLFSAASLRSMAFQLPELGLLSLAMLIPLLSGGLDLSIIATANLSALAMAWMCTHALPGSSGLNSALWVAGALVAGLAVAALVGALNGWLIAHLRVSPILATLGSMTVVKGIAVGFTHGGVISGFPTSVRFLGHGLVFGIPAALLLFVAVAIPISIMLTRSPLGVRIAMIGSNERATSYAGVDTKGVQMRVYLLSSLLSALAGLVMMARFDSANAAYGESYLLVTILAAVLGGVSPTGGFGRVSGLVLALVVLQLISTAASMIDLGQFITLSIWGATLIGVAGAGALRTWWGTRKLRG
ncbi:ABC transporter permease [Paraburkholderia nemoris]|uniref:ABC transporter permease n=1 Tax=Paraburkholderia nemoris TaxID=2793076 RepID=UPI0038BC1164